MIEIEKIQHTGNKKKVDTVVTTAWKNSRMIIQHSVRAAVREILNLSQSLDVVKVNIIGSPSTGKTTLALTLTHLCHKMADIPYNVKVYGREDLLNFENVLAQLQPTNHIMVFDDISFLSATAGKRQIEKIQKAFTEIRHLPGGKDVKIIAIFNFHYNMAVSKYMRQSDYFLYTSVGSSELENTLALVGKKYQKKILEFRRILQSALTKHKYKFMLGKKRDKPFIYTWRKPFAPVLFWNNDTLRIIVSPERKWIDPICTVCANSKPGEVIKQLADLKQFDEDSKRFGKSILRQALKIKLFSMGVETYSKRVRQAMSWLDTQMSESTFDVEALAEFYDLKEKKTRLDKVDRKKPASVKLA